MSIAVPKPGLAESNQISTSGESSGKNSSSDQAAYAQYYEQYWADKAAWGNYGTFKVRQFNVKIKYNDFFNLLIFLAELWAQAQSVFCDVESPCAYECYRAQSRFR